MNGVWDVPGEVGVAEVQIGLYDSAGTLISTAYTDKDGGYCFVELEAGTYTLTEVLPGEGWANTTPLSIPVTVEAGASSEGNNFGNICLGGGGGFTIGYWTNKNGQATMNDGGTDATELALLTSLNLRNADGTDFDPGTYVQLRNWLRKADSTNMAYMLSAQLAAMELNVEAGTVNGDALVYAPGVASADAAGFISINALMNEANLALGADGSTPSGDPNRAYQELLKNALDAANNNLNFL